MKNITLHNLARDVAEMVEKLGGGHAVVVGHAYGNWVARMTATDHPDLVRGVVIAAAAAKQYAPELSTAVTNAGNLLLSDEQRLAALRFGFFAPGNDPAVWLKGWHPEIRDSRGPRPRRSSRTNGGRAARRHSSTYRPRTIRSSRNQSATR